VVILGGGLTGISAALHLEMKGVDYVLVEKQERLGGLAKTECIEGYYFDHTGHWLHLRDPYMTDFVTRRCSKANLRSVQRNAQVYTSGALTPYPFQANLGGLPKDIAFECLNGFVKQWTKKQQGRHIASKPANFEEFIVQHFGEGIAAHFMIPYNKKIWGVHPREISADWCQRFVPRPNLDEVLRGVCGYKAEQLGYNTSFLYPNQGGIERMTRELCADLPADRLMLGSAVEKIDISSKVVVLHTGEKMHYDSIISTMPLPQLIGAIGQGAESSQSVVPTEVVEATINLQAQPLTYVNVGTAKKVNVDYHWAYFAEEKWPFYRVGVFSNAMPSMAPIDCSSLYVELSVDEKTKTVAPNKRVAEALFETGVIGAIEDIKFMERRQIDPAYVIFDHAYSSATECIHAYLKAHTIHSCGRYGSWIYNAMEDSLIAGRVAADQVVSPANELS